MKLSLALSLASVTTTRPFAAASFAEPHAILDLSKDLEFAPNLNESPGALAVLAVAEADPGLRTTMVIENGKIVASYTRDGLDLDVLTETWSVTKSITSLLYGILVDEGLLGSTNVTLGEIFTDESNWEGVPDVESRKNITIKEMLTMTSGLIDPTRGAGWIEPFSTDFCNNGLNHFLRAYETGRRGSFSYLPVADILGYAFTELTGMQPRAFLADRVLAPLGIEDADIDWVETSGFGGLPLDCGNNRTLMYAGLQMTAMQLAKIGLLHLARGVASPDKRVVSSDWIEASLTKQVVIEEYYQGGPPSPSDGMSHGYQAWFVDVGQAGYAYASGNAGQYVCVGDKLGRVTVQQRDVGGYLAGQDDNPAFVGMDPSLDFSVDDANKVPGEEKDKVDTEDVENQPSAGSCATTKMSWLMMLGAFRAVLNRWN